MKIKRLVLCIVITMILSFGLGTIGVLADETQRNEQLHTSEFEVESIEQSLTATEEVIAERADEVTEEVVDLLTENEEVKAVAKESAVEAATAVANEVVIEKVTAKVTSDKVAVKEVEKETTKETTTEEKPAQAVLGATKVFDTKETKYTKSELRLLSALIYAEAGNQSYKGKLAVANVVINRMNSKLFSHCDTIKEVIYDNKWGVQFSVIKKNSNGSSPLTKALSLYDNIDSKSGSDATNMKSAVKAAKAALTGSNNIGSYLYFSRTSSYLKSKYSNHVIIGDHIFYNTK